MALKCICLIILTVGAASGASQKSESGNIKKISKNRGNRVSALYVKNSESGDLRFLTGSSNVNSALNQYITQKQNLLEQLRPNMENTNSGIGTTNMGTLGTLGTLGTFGSSNNNGITPIIVNLGNTGTSSTNNNALQGVASGASPIGYLLPQIIAKAVLSQRRNQIQNTNRRRVVNNRRKSGGPQIFVIRPNA